MPKNLFFLLLAVFSLTIIIVMVNFFLDEKKHESHLYFGAEGGNAEIYLGQKKIGTAPIKDYLLPSGYYELTLVTDYYTYTTPIQLAPKTATIVDWQIGANLAQSAGTIYELSPITSPAGELAIASSPERAIVTLDGGELTPNTFTPYHTDILTPGEHTLTLSLPGYLDRTLSFTLTPGYLLKLTVKLATAE